jgi:sigma-E factor negative regulatory protein RseC
VIEEQARVVGLRGELAEVVTRRHAACGSCAAKGGCGTSLIAEWFGARHFTFLLKNDIGATPGDDVIIGLDEGRLQRGSLLLYALPLAGLLLGAIGGEWWFAYVGLPAELGAVTTGLLGLIIALTAVRRLSTGEAMGEQGGVRLLRIVGGPPSLAPRDIGFARAYPTESTRKCE